MKKKILIILGITIISFIGYRAYRISTTRSHSPAETTTFSFEGLDLSVTYGRPYKKGRMIFGDAHHLAMLPEGKFWTVAYRLLTGLPDTKGALVPNGKYWRLGANEATEISFSKDILFANEPVRAGRYRMYAVPYENEWDVVLNSELGMFGYNEPNYALDVIKVHVPVESSSSVTEQFTITFDNDSSGAIMNFNWDTTLVRVPIVIH